MASVVIPPWLDVNPKSFVDASAEGARLGLERRGQDIGQQEEQAKLGMSQAEMAQNAMLEQQKLAATRQIAQQRLGLQTQLAARKFQQQQAYQSAIQSGMDPIQAMMQFGPTMGQSMAGVGQLGLMEMRQKQADLPPQFLENPNDPNNPYAVRLGGQWQKLNQPKAKAAVPDKLTKEKRLAAIAKFMSPSGGSLSLKDATELVDSDEEKTDNTPSPDFTYNVDTGVFEPVAPASDESEAPPEEQ